MEEIPIYCGKLKNILIISGGGMKGYCALGAVCKLKELEIIDEPDVYCGTSIGSSLCFLLAIGYSCEDIFSILYDINSDMLIKYNIDTILNDSHFGIANLDAFISVINILVKKKKISRKITFKKLFNKFKKDLIITGVCLNENKLHYFNHINNPDMPIITAIKISCSIPFIFKPVLYNNKVWIDGGCLNNYPINYFIDRLDDVIGISLEDEEIFIEKFDDIPSYFIQIFKCILKGLNFDKYEKYYKNTIKIKVTSNYTFFDITKEEKKILFNHGYNTVEKYFFNNSSF
jgi:predicted acylesterase/phospholipase RssA